METQNQDVAHSPAEVANDPGKMFVGGLSWQTSPEAVLEMMKTKCSECDDTLKTLIRDLTWRLREWFTEEYGKLAQKYHLEDK